MRAPVLYRRYFSVPDLIILLLIGTVIYGIVTIGNEWRASFNPVTSIDLSAWALPRYTLFSAIRGVVAYLISLAFTLVVGYSAAKSRSAEQIIIPLLDILQSIPVLGFLPGLVLGLIALFPHTNVGLELAAVIMIFLGQVWNMTFSFYASLKSIPTDFAEASTVIGLSRWDRLIRLELPFSAVNLGWNSLMSMAGGWFFLSVCEAFSMQNQEFRLPGVGAYMAVASAKGDYRAMVLGLVAMVVLIVTMDFVIWRPILAWIQKFRLEDVPGVAPAEPLMRLMFRESRIVRYLKVVYRRYMLHRRMEHWLGPRPQIESHSEPPLAGGRKTMRYRVDRLLRSRAFARVLEISVGVLAIAGLTFASLRLVHVLLSVDLSTWVILLRNMTWTLLRVILAILISTLWAVPAGIWIGVSPARVRVAQPIIQVLASFPAPMLYPIALTVFLGLGMNFSWCSVFLMLLGVQWYVLFNVLAGALRIPQELRYALDLMKASRWTRWKTLYLPSVFPALVTGWITAAGGAWNASIVAEVVKFHDQTLETNGLGATITDAASREDFKLLAASLMVMVFVVVILNRTFWARIYHLAQTRFRLDL